MGAPPGRLQGRRRSLARHVQWPGPHGFRRRSSRQPCGAETECTRPRCSIPSGRIREVTVVDRGEEAITITGSALTWPITSAITDAITGRHLVQPRGGQPVQVRFFAKDGSEIPTVLALMSSPGNPSPAEIAPATTHQRATSKAGSGAGLPLIGIATMVALARRRPSMAVRDDARWRMRPAVRRRGEVTSRCRRGAVSRRRRSHRRRQLAAPTGLDPSRQASTRWARVRTYVADGRFRSARRRRSGGMGSRWASRRPGFLTAAPGGTVVALKISSDAGLVVAHRRQRLVAIGRRRGIGLRPAGWMRS